MKKAALTFIVLLSLFLIACTPKVICNDPYIMVGSSCCLDQNHNNICDQDDSRDGNFLQRDNIQNESIKTNESSTSTLTYSTLAKIQKEIQLVIDGEASWVEVERGKYFELGARNRASVVVLNEPLVSSAEFVEMFNAENWPHEGRFVNLSAYNHLFKPVPDQSFSNSILLQEYRQEGTFVQKETHERTFLLDNGKVIEYQQLNWEYDRYNYFKGEWQENVVVYKIYCNPELIIYLRPEDKDTRINVLTAKLDDVQRVWETNVQDFRPAMLQKANRILKSCAVEKSFFADMPNAESDTNIVYSHHDPTYLQLYWNMVTTIDSPIKRSIEKKEFNTVDYIRVSFENKEEDMIKGPLFIDIRTIADDGHERDYVHDKRIVGNFLSGETITKTFYPEAEPQFKEKLVIKVKLYTEDGSTPIRPQEFTIKT